MEDFVTYEQAIKLKELEFNWECHYRYNINKQLVPNVVYSNCGVDSDDLAVDVNFRCIGDISAPTLSQAAKWIREKYNLFIHVYLHLDDCWLYEIQYIFYYDYHKYKPEDEQWWRPYEQALSAGIDQALELLKQQNNGTKA